MFGNCYGPKNEKTLSTRTNRVNNQKLRVSWDWGCGQVGLPLPV